MEAIMNLLSPAIRRPTAAVRVFVRRHPISVFLVIVFGVFYPALGIPRLYGWSIPAADLTTVLAGTAFGLLFGGSVLVTCWSDGPAGVSRLLHGVLRWRIGVARYLLVLGALPALTLLIAAATGTLQTPPEGWAGMAGRYLLTVVLGALSTNLWEEAAWGGFVQGRLMGRYGLLAGSLLTAVPFVLIHVPGAFQNTTTGAALVDVVAIAVLAPFLRYLIGTVLLDTAGSVLAVGLLHASMNASGRLSAAHGGWQFLPAVFALTVLVAGYRSITGDRSHPESDTRGPFARTVRSRSPLMRAAGGSPAGSTSDAVSRPSDGSQPC
jgi:uncharacterized protein